MLLLLGSSEADRGSGNRATPVRRILMESIDGGKCWETDSSKARAHPALMCVN